MKLSLLARHTQSCSDSEYAQRGRIFTERFVLSVLVCLCVRETEREGGREITGQGGDKRINWLLAALQWTYIKKKKTCIKGHFIQSLKPANWHQGQLGSAERTPTIDIHPPKLITQSLKYMQPPKCKKWLIINYIVKLLINLPKCIHCFSFYHLEWGKW